MDSFSLSVLKQDYERFLENTISIGSEDRIAAPEASARFSKATQDDVKRDWGNTGSGETAV
ncbi:hypothetical protein A1OO_12275 [Enterovibrio norvegicus FF-33]|nr:hypothetical protein A1OO_12275 [Enterovibrio norvegicus FF-33]